MKKNLIFLRLNIYQALLSCDKEPEYNGTK